MSDLERLASDIQARGVTRVFGIPGSGTSYTLLDALEKRGVEFQLTHFEGSAALMAGAVARLSNDVGVSVSIKGPGLSNMVPGLATCLLEALPVVSISEAYAPDTPAWRTHKRMDHVGLLGAVTKGRRFLSPAATEFAEMADWAGAEIPGPVHLDLTADGVEDEPAPARVAVSRDDSSRDALRGMLASASRPVVIAGTLAVRRGWHAKLGALGVPVFTTAAAKGTVDERLDHAAGVYTGVGLELAPESQILPKADLVVGLGLRDNEVLSAKPFDCPAVNIDPAPAGAAGFGLRAVADDADDWVAEVFGLLGDRAWGVEDVVSAQRALRDAMLSGGAFLPAHAYDLVERRFEHEVRSILDTGYFCTIGEHALRVPRPEAYLASGQGRYMGVGLPLGIGAALHDPSLPTAVFLGDGSMGMFVAEAKIAVEKKLPLLVVLLTDGYLGSVRTRALKDGLSENPVVVPCPSWMAPMQAFGLAAERAENADQLEGALAQWRPESGPLFVEAVFAPQAYQDMVNGIR